MLYKVASLYRKNRLQSRIILVNNRKALFSRRYSWHIDYNVVCKMFKQAILLLRFFRKDKKEFL